MLNKLVTNDSYQFDLPSSTVVPSYSRGFDVAHWQKKYASENLFAKTLSELKPDKDETVLHIIGLGDEETLGPNRNNDAFARADNQKCHKTFVELGHLFRDHKNTDPELACGRVIDSGHNPQMGRVELLVGLNNRKCAKDIQKVEKGEDIAFSMGSAQDYDVCSHCKNKAETADKHCDHIKNHLGEVTEDGKKIYMKNPNPKFFDISIVWKPADRIAYMLKKVASGQARAETGSELAERFGITEDMDMAKLAEMRRIATIIKQVPAVGSKPKPKSVRADTKDELKKAAAAYGVDTLLRHLTKHAILLSAEDFGDIAVQHSQPYVCCALDDTVPVNMNELLDEHAQIGAFEPTIYTEHVPLSKQAQYELAVNCSMQPDHVTRRAIQISIAGPQKKVAAAMDSIEARGTVDLYRHYKLAFMRQHLDNTALVRLTAATF
jgi:hypothetical protein